MSIEPLHLLEQAEHLARREPRRPRQTSLRRALSTGYYALFHLLVRDAILQIGPGLETRHFNQLYRCFEHGQMANVARAFGATEVKYKDSQNRSRILLEHNPPLLQIAARTFVEMQQLRHDADYDPGALFQRQDVLLKLSEIRAIFDGWEVCKQTAEGQLFLLSLLLWKEWGKRQG